MIKTTPRVNAVIYDVPIWHISTSYMVYFNVYNDNNNMCYLFLFKINIIFSGLMSMTKNAFTIPGITYIVHISHISTS